MDSSALATPPGLHAKPARVYTPETRDRTAMACWQIPVMGPPDPEHTAKGDVSSNGLPDQVQASTSAREAQASVVLRPPTRRKKR